VFDKSKGLNKIVSYIFTNYNFTICKH